MKIDEEFMTEEQFERRLWRSMYSGERSASKGIAHYLLTKSGEAFSCGNDEHARLLRELSKEVTKLFYDSANAKVTEFSDAE